MTTNLELFNDGEITLEKILQKFEKNENSVKGDIEVLKNWMRDQPHLPEILDAKSLKNFLILNKFSIEKSKQKIDMYYTVRSKLGDVYDQINPKLLHMRQLTDIACIYLFIHPEVTQDMKRVCFFKLRDKNLVDKLEPCNILRHLINIQEIRLRHDVTSGGIFIVDCADIPLYLVLKVSPSFVFTTLITIYEKVFSSRLGAIYLLNCPHFFEILYQMAKKIMKPKLFQRIHICSSVDELKQYFPRDFLPKEFGGDGPSCEELQDLMKKKFGECQDLFDHLDDIQVDETCRPEKLIDSEILGYYGNFTKLDID